MKSKLKYIVIIAGLFLLLLLTEILLPKPVSWVRTLSSDDKIPYGTYVLKETLLRNNESFDPDLSRSTFFELDDSVKSNFLVITDRFANGKDDFEALLGYVSEGNSVIIAAGIFDGVWNDSLGISTKDVLQSYFEDTANPIIEDSTFISWKDKKYFYKPEDNNTVFESPDSSWIIRAKHEEGNPVIISTSIGQGQLILSSNPWIFTNYYLLSGQEGLANNVLSLLPEDAGGGNLQWSEFYSRGRNEASTPLRYILSVPTLKWAYYILAGTLILLILFESKRKQRAIPIIKPPANESLDFAKTVGNLYFEKGDHKNIANKMIGNLFEQIRTRYYLSTNDIDEDFIQRLTQKSGKVLINVEGLMTMINIFRSKERIGADELMSLNRKIEAFLN